MPRDDHHEYISVSRTQQRMPGWRGGYASDGKIGGDEFNSHSGLVKREDREDVTMVVGSQDDPGLKK